MNSDYILLKKKKKEKKEKNNHYITIVNIKNVLTTCIVITKTLILQVIYYLFELIAKWNQ